MTLQADDARPSSDVLAAVEVTEVTVVPPLEADPVFVSAVDEAVLGDALADSPEAQPDRKLVHATDFSSLYIRHRGSLEIHARRFLQDSRDIDEVVQETFLRLFLAISEIETELQAISFARRTLTNLCIDRYRAERRRPRLVNLDDAQVYDLGDEADLEDPVLRAEDAAVVREALSLLSPLHRAALVKREIEEKPLAQIAAELDVPEESVKHLLFRARRALRRLLVGTSVEPGADLTIAQVAVLANRRAGRAIMQSANALIIFFVGALVLAVGLGSLTASGRRPAPSETDPSNSTGSIAPPVGLPQQSTSPGTPTTSGHHGATAGKTPTPTTSQAPPALHPSPTTGSGKPTPHNSPSTPPSSNPPAGGRHGHFQLNGPLQVEGSPRTGPVETEVNADQSQTTVSQFTAATSEGTFALTQSLTQAAVGGAPSVTVAPAFIVGDDFEPASLTGMSANVSPNSDGTVTVDVIAATQPDTSTNAFPLTSLEARFVMSQSLDRVLSESVTVGTSPPAAATPSPSPSPTGSTPPGATPAPTETPGSATSDSALVICPMADTAAASGPTCTGSSGPA